MLCHAKHPFRPAPAHHPGKGASRPKDGFFLRAESFYNLSTNLDELDAQPAFAPKLIGAYGGKSLHRQSHGESFLALALNRFGPQGLYLLDEPEAALSVQGQLTLLSRIHQLASQGCQFIIATHSPILLGFPDAQIYLFGDEIAPVAYEDTDAYCVTKAFLNNRKGMLKELLN